MSIRNKIGICYKVLLGAAVLGTGVGLVLYTSESIETAGKAAAMCIEVILPSLFPFLVVSNLIIGLGFAEAVGRIASPVMRRLFNLNGSCASAFIMGSSADIPSVRAPRLRPTNGGCVPKQSVNGCFLSATIPVPRSFWAW